MNHHLKSQANLLKINLLQLELEQPQMEEEEDYNVNLPK